MSEIHSKLGKIDVLFVNAGISHCPPILETDEAASVIFTSSAAQDMGRLGDPLYSATKAAIRNLVRTLASSEDAFRRKIRVNAVTPGCVKTPLTEQASSSPEVSAYLEAIIPLRRWGEVEEVGKAVLFLASNDSSYMTGAEIAVDGGLAQI